MEMDRMLYDMIDIWWLLLIDHDFWSEKDVNKIIGKVMDWRLHEIHTGIHVGSGDVLHADTIHFSVSGPVLSHFSQWTVMNKPRAPQLGYCLGSQLPTGFNAEKGDKWVKIYRKLMEMVLAILPSTSSTRFPRFYRVHLCEKQLSLDMTILLDMRSSLQRIPRPTECPAHEEWPGRYPACEAAIFWELVAMAMAMFLSRFLINYHGDVLWDMVSTCKQYEVTTLFGNQKNYGERRFSTDSSDRLKPPHVTVLYLEDPKID